MSPRVRRNRTILAAALTALVVVAVQLTHPFNGSHRSTLAAARPPAPGVVVPAPLPDPGGDDTSGTLPPIIPAVAGHAQVVSQGPAGSNDLSLTFDDGDCDPCVAGLVAGVERTGAHVTFCPNGVYGPPTWDNYAERIKALIAKGQVSICNHTWDHKDLTKLNAQQIRTELTRNEQWIEKTFDVTARPFFRPPYGAHNRTVDQIAAQLGYTQVLMWSGTLGDSIGHPPDFIVSQMQMYAKPGLIILGHGNHPATASVFDQLVGVAQQAGLHLVTVAELLNPPVIGVPSPGGER